MNVLKRIAWEWMRLYKIKFDDQERWLTGSRMQGQRETSRQIEAYARSYVMIQKDQS